MLISSVFLYNPSHFPCFSLAGPLRLTVTEQGSLAREMLLQVKFLSFTKFLALRKDQPLDGGWLGSSTFLAFNKGDCPSFPTHHSLPPDLVRGEFRTGDFCHL